MPSRALERLDLATSSKLRSTQIITSLPQIVSELVQNSLDAGASSIEVGVHRDEWSCWVRDNGSGIGKDGLAQVAEGRSGGRYVSSKAYDPRSLHKVDTFGFRGEALASISDLSCLEISTRTKFAKESRTLILRNGICLYNGPSVRSRRDATGTNIFVREAFFNVPVRRMAHPLSPRTLDIIRRDIETLALAHPHVQFKLCDTSRTSQDGRDRSLVLAIPKTSSSYLTFKHLYGRALVEHAEHIDSKVGSIHLYGFLSLVGSHSTAYQFIYLNRHILDACELHRVIERKFASSSFAKHALDENGEATDDGEEGKRRSPRKSVRKPIYVLNVDIPRHQVDNLLEPTKSSVHLQDQTSVISFLADVFESFLTKHGFKSHSVPIANPSPKLRKSTKRTFDTSHSLSRAESPSKKSRSPLIESTNGPIIGEGAMEELTWVDPTTKKVYVIDPRTGNSYAREEPLLDTQTADIRPTNVNVRRMSQCCKPNTTETPEWIKRALDGNEAFLSAEAPVRSMPSPIPFQNDEPGYGEERIRIPWKKQFNRTFSTTLKGMSLSIDISSSSFDKRSLEEAEVLGQVDSKFIACLLTVVEDGEAGASCNGLRALVLIDQHAVDERIRVERFLKALCEGFLDRNIGGGVARRTLRTPVPILLTKFESDRLTQSEHMRNALSDWGLEVDHNPDPGPGVVDDDSAHGMIYFKTVPEVVADKLLAKSGSDLRGLVKGFLARLESEGCSSSSQRPSAQKPSSKDSAPGWLSALRDCPRELIDLVNSRACRGAIMFNDVLSDEQCRRLVRQLAQTAFPFQCAHGRPSVVPLTMLKREAGAGGRDESEDRPVDWAKLL